MSIRGPWLGLRAATRGILPADSCARTSQAGAAIYAIYKQPSPTGKTDGCQYLVDIWPAADGGPEGRAKSLTLLALPRGRDAGNHFNDLARVVSHEVSRMFSCELANRAAPLLTINLRAKNCKRGKNHGGGAVAAVVADDMLPRGLSNPRWLD